VRTCYYQKVRGAVASNGITFIQTFVNIREFVQKLNGEDRPTHGDVINYKQQKLNSFQFLLVCDHRCL
jgi:hypothetical protein